MKPLLYCTTKLQNTGDREPVLLEQLRQQQLHATNTLNVSPKQMPVMLPSPALVPSSWTENASYIGRMCCFVFCHLRSIPSTTVLFWVRPCYGFPFSVPHGCPFCVIRVVCVQKSKFKSLGPNFTCCLKHYSLRTAARG